MLSWCLFLSDSLFSSHSWGIAPVLYLGSITVERPLMYFLVCISCFLYYVVDFTLYLVCGFLQKSDWYYTFSVVVCLALCPATIQVSLSWSLLVQNWLP